MFKQNVPRFLFRALIPPGLHCRELKTADVELRGLNKIAAKPKAAKFVKQKFGSRVENAILVEQSIIANGTPSEILKSSKAIQLYFGNQYS